MQILKLSLKGTQTEKRKFKIAKINTSQMQVPPKTLNLVLAINKHLKVGYILNYGWLLFCWVAAILLVSGEKQYLLAVRSGLCKAIVCLLN